MVMVIDLKYHTIYASIGAYFTKRDWQVLERTKGLGSTQAAGFVCGWGSAPVSTVASSGSSLKCFGARSLLTDPRARALFQMFRNCWNL